MNKKPDRNGLEIAVIGMSGRFPGAGNLDEFWNNLKEGREAITFFQDRELLESGIDAQQVNNPQYIKARGILAGKELFDASFFGYTPSEALVMEPQTRNFYECSWEALEDAGYDPGAYDGLIGVYAGGASSFRWEALTLLSGAAANVDFFSASQLMNTYFLSTRISYKLNLKGPSVFIQTACSTSLVTIHMACQALLAGECNLALAGGAALSYQEQSGYMHQEGMVYSPDGHCRAFAAHSSGIVEGEGIGVVVLKPLEEAMADNDHIYAVIKATAINNDGVRKVGYSAPSAAGQVEVIKAALHMAEVESESITYIEAHGTGTSLGDPVEMEALKVAFKTGKKQFCRIGSVKSNIGHLDTAAGVAGFIKTVLALEHKLIPPSLHAESPNPQLDIENTPFVVVSTLTPWENDTYPLRAGVSSFGIGGTNAHVILEEAPVREESSGGRPSTLITLSARTNAALDRATGRLAEFLMKNPGVKLADVAYTLQTGRKIFNHRRVLVCADVNDAVRQLTEPGFAKARTFTGERIKRPVVFLFSAQGSQYVNMGLEIYRTEPGFRADVDHGFDVLNALTGLDIKSVLYPGQTNGSEEKKSEAGSEDIDRIIYTSPIKFIFEYSLARLIMRWGIKPAAMIGHSFGEYVAACLAGVFSFEDALRLISLRGKLIYENVPKSSMMSISISAAELKPFLNDDIALAAVNGPSTCIVSGSDEDVEAFGNQMKEKGVECTLLRTPRAGHSKMMDPILEPFLEVVKQVKINKPQSAFISGLSGTWIRGEDAVDPRYWVRHLRETIRFADGLTELLKEENAIFIQVGSDQSISSLVSQHPAKTDKHLVLNLVRHPKDNVRDDHFLLNKLGLLWLYGLDIDGSEFYAQERRNRISLPPYSFDRHSYWIKAAGLRAGMKNIPGLLSPGKEPDMSKWFYIPSWKRVRLPQATGQEPGLNPGVLVFLDGKGIGSRLLKRLERKNPDLAIVVVKEGPVFAGPTDHKVYEINPREPGDYDRLVSHLGASTALPRTLIHCWNITDGSDEEILTRGFHCLLHLGRVLTERFPGEPFTILAITERMAEVDGNENLVPAKAALLGAVKAIPREHPRIRCRSIDIPGLEPGSPAEEALIHRLVQEVRTDTGEPLAAYRGKHRWVQSVEKFSLQSPLAKPEHLKENGVYLIVGKRSETATAVLADYLSGSLKARLVFLEGSELPLESAAAQLEVVDGCIYSPGDKELETVVRDITALETFFTKVKPGFAVLGSSIAADPDAPAQAGQVAVKAFLDAWAGKNTRRTGILTIHIQWDRLISEDSGGDEGLLPSQGVAAFERIMAEGSLAQVIVYPGDLNARFERQTLAAADNRDQGAEAELFSQAALQRPGLSTEYTPPGNEIEQKLVAIWQKFFGINPIGIHDDFFELGGDSLKAMTIISRIHKEFDLKLQVAEFFTTPTIRELAQTFPGAEADKFSAVQAVEKREYYTLSSAQKRLYVLYRMDMESTAYNMPQLKQLEGEISGEKLELTFKALIQRHESLRTSFSLKGETAVQEIHETVPFHIDFFELSEAKANDMVKHFVRPFDLSQVPLLRVRLIKMIENKYVLLVDMPHIITDLVSGDVLMEEFMDLYEGDAGKVLPLLRLQYKDYAQWQHDKKHQETIKQQEEYWLKEFEGEPPLLDLPTDFKRPEVQDFAGNNLDFWVDKDELERIKAIIRREEVTLYMLMLGVFNVFMARLSGSDDIIIGTPTAGRSHVDLQRVIGMFVNTLALRNYPHGEKSFNVLLREIKARTLQAFANQDYQFEELVEKLGLERDTSRNPLFDVVLALRNVKLSAVELQRLQSGRQVEDRTSAIFDMLFGYADLNDLLNINIQYRTGLFKKETIQRFGRYFKQVITQTSQNPDIKIAEIELLTPEERAELLVEFNNSAAAYPRQRSLIELFAEQVLPNPDRTAVLETEPGETGERSLTYSQLHKRANRLAWVLKEKGVRAGSLVGLMSRRSIEAVAAVLAVIKAGGAFLPIEADLPEPRKRFMIADSQAQILLAQRSLIPENTPLFQLLPPGSVIPMDEDIPDPVKPGKATLVSGGENIAYVLYTSGSTGQPKGVMVSQANLINYLGWAIKQYVGEKETNFPLFTSLSFDLTVTSIFTPLLSGNTIVVYGGIAGESLIEKVMEDNRVDIVKLTPSHLKLIVNAWDRKGPNWAGKIDSRIRCFIVGGEALETTLARQIHAGLKNPVEIYNEYGPTETTVGCMIYRYNPESDHRPSVPIGTPAAKVQLYLLDKNHKPVPKGVAGEMYISGAGVARGYLNRVELTAEKFIANPFIPGQRMYRTGDLARFPGDSPMEFLGRVDQQVKIRGFRIELGEIENRLKAYRKNKPVQVSYQENVFAESDEVQRCSKCLLPANYPAVGLDEEGVCNTCREYEKYKSEVDRYFKTGEDFIRLVDGIKSRKQGEKQGEYDCLLLFSGGKDSTFVLYQLIDMGLKVLTFTFDNGYISSAAFANIKRTTSHLGVENIIYRADKMNDVFVESLNSHHDVCHGCWNALNTLGVKVAHQRGIDLVISGLSRGQIFEMRLEGLFQGGIFTEEEIQKNLLLFRKTFHSQNNPFSRILDVQLSEAVVEQIQFVDFFRYFNIPVKEIRAYLERKGWVQPVDTGFCSSNCVINDVGIYVFQAARGYHFYAAQLSWDCRLGVISREQGLREIEFEGKLEEVDRILKEVGYYEPPVKDAIVLEKETGSGEKTLAAYVVLNETLTVSQLREYLAAHLPAYMIPGQFVRVEKIPLTANGKVDRKALRRAGKQLDSGRAYVAPGNETEKKLAGIWAEVLDLKQEKISIHDDFFLLGGNSLKATSLLAKIHKELNTAVTLPEIFKWSTVNRLQELIREKSSAAFITLEKVEDRDYYPLSSAQKRLYFIYRMDNQSIIYNMPQTIALGSNADREKLEQTFRELIQRHEMLRASFGMIGEEPIQQIHDNVDFRVEYRETGAEGAKEILGKFIRPFVLSDAPAMRATMIRIDGEENILLLDLHHIITDGISNAILSDEFKALYQGMKLTGLCIRYRDFAQWQNSRKQRELIKKQEEFWLREFAGELPVINLPVDFPRPAVQSFAGSTLGFEIAAEQTALLRQLAAGEGTTLFMVLMALYTILAAKLSGQEDIVVGTVLAGRRHAELEKIVGMFANTMALRNYPVGEKSFQQFLAQVKERALNAFENQEYQFEDLVEKVVKKRDTSRSPIFEVGLALQNLSNQGEENPAANQEDTEPRFYLENTISRIELSLNAIEEEQRLLFLFEYAAKLFKKETIRRFSLYFKEIAAAVLKNPGIRLSDIEILTEEEKNQILVEFNNTNSGELPLQTIHGLFAQEAQRRPGQTALSVYLDLSDLHDALREGKTEAVPLKDLENCCFRKNPYIFQFNNQQFVKSLDIIDKDHQNRLVMLHTHKLDWVAVNRQTLLLLDYFSGTANLKSVLKGLSGQTREYIVYTFAKDEYTDFSVKRRFLYTLERDAGVRDLLELICLLFGSHLIGLSGYNFDEAVLSVPPAEDTIDFAAEKPAAAAEVAPPVKYGKNLKSPVLLLGDRVGQASTGLLYIASYLRRNGVEAYCWWNNMNSDLPSLQEGIETVMARIRPRVVGVSMKWFPHIARVLEICKTVKACDPTVEVVVGGNTGAYYKDDVIAYEEIDYVVKGDGELPFLAICAGEKKIPNCLYKREGKIIETPITYVHDAENNPEYYFSHLDQVFVNQKDPFLAPYYYINTGKGCAMQCLYCAGDRHTQKKVFNRPKPFLRSTAEVKKDMQAAMKYTSTFWFDFDIPLADTMDYYKQIWDGLDLSRYFCEFYFWKLPSREFIDEAVKNFKYVYFNIDLCSLSEPHRLKLAAAGHVKPQPTDEELFSFFDRCEQYDSVEVIINQISGLPWFSEEDIERSNQMLSLLHQKYSTLGLVDWGRLHAQPGAPIVHNYPDFDMHCYAKSFEEFLSYSQLNLKEAPYPTLENFNYPYIYYNDEGFNSRISQFYADATARVHHYVETKEKRKQPPLVLDFSYKELDEQSGRLARVLTAKGLQPGTIVGIMMERSLQMITAMLAVLKAGAAYLPLDPGYPRERIKYMLTDSDLDIVLTNKDNVNTLSPADLEKSTKTQLVPYMGKKRAQFKEVDKLPIPDRSLIDYEKYDRYIGLSCVKGSLALQATRGCPYKCAYCHKIWPKSHLYRSAENLFTEVKAFYDMGVRRFTFIDDIFNLNRKNSMRFFHLIIENGLDLQIFFNGGLRGDILDEEYIDLMVEAGVVDASLALETASPRLQKVIGKELDIEKLRKNIDYITRKYPQLILELFIMHGLPTETEAEAKMTLEFLKELKWIHFPYFNITRIYPNTDAEKIAIANGISKEAIYASANLAFHELPTTLPFDKSFTKACQAEFLNDYFLAKERLLHVLPYQMKILSEDELVQKYNSYLPVEINEFQDFLDFVNIKREELGDAKCIENNYYCVPHMNLKVKEYFGEPKVDDDALRVLLLDLTQSFSEDWNQLNNLVDMPLGLMYLASFIRQQFGSKVHPKIAKPMIDFDSYDQLHELLTEFKPDIIGVRTLTFYKKFIHRGIEKIRQFGYTGPLIAGGPYATSEYTSILQDTNIDLVVIGEGEVTFAELIEHMINNNKTFPGDEILKTIPGITFVPNREQYRHKKSRELILVDRIAEDFPDESNRQPLQTDWPGNPADLAYVIYTSGTTGFPKGVAINHANVISLVKNQNYIDFSPGDKLLMTGSVVFDISTFEIWGSLLNGIDLYLAEKETILDSEKLTALVSRQGIGILHLIPQLFNLAFSQHPELFAGLRCFLVGGDMVNSLYLNRLREKYPHLEIRHMYGPTENTTFSTYLAVEQEYRGGVPIGAPLANRFVFITDKYMRLQPLGVAGEICVGGAGLARGYMNQPELTAERFCLRRPGALFEKTAPGPRKNFLSDQSAIANQYLPEGHLILRAKSQEPRAVLYKTGDLGRWTPEGNIEFLGRFDHQVKIRGMRIELGEIESRLAQHPGIKDAVAISRESNSGDKILCAYFVARPDAFENASPDDELGEFLAAVLPDYMIPTYFIPLEKIPLTPNGKVDRDALPEPGANFASSDQETPGNEIEEKLVEIWSEVLGTAVGINDNFFKAGGDSIKTIQVSARLREYNLELKINDLFLNPTIKLAAKIVKKTSGYMTQHSDRQGIVRGHVHLTPIQRSFFENYRTRRHHLNLALMFYKETGFEENFVKRVFAKIVEHHDALRMIYKINGNEVFQENRGWPGEFFSLEVIDFSGKSDAETRITGEAERIQQGIDLETGPLVKLALFKTKKGDHLLVAVHHLVADAVSLRIILEDLGTAYRQLEKGEDILLPPKTDSFKHWAYQLKEYAESNELLRELKYWRHLEENPPAPLPRDHYIEEEMKRRKWLESIRLELDEAETRKLLKDVNHAYNTEIEDLLLAALALGIKESWAIDRVAVALERHGREEIIEDIDLGRTVGWFTTQFPVILDMSQSRQLAHQIKFTKETLRKIPAKGIGYGILRYLTPQEKKDNMGFDLEPEISFNYLGQMGQIGQGDNEDTGDTIRMSAVNPGESISPELEFNYAIDINGAVRGGKLALAFTYNKNEYNRANIENLTAHCKANLLKIIAHCSNKKEPELTPADVGCNLSISDFARIVEDVRAIPRNSGENLEINFIYPLAPMQEGILFHSIMNKDHDPYLGQTSFTLGGEIDINLLEKSFNKLIERYDILRTVFSYETSDKPVQVVFKERRSAIGYEDLSSLREKERLHYLEKFKKQELEKGFDLTKGLLTKISILKTGKESYEWVWSFHHILMDGWCLGIIFSDLIRLYRSFRLETPLELETPPPYLTYITWLQKQNKAEGIKAWQDYLEGYERPMGLPKSGNGENHGKHEQEVGKMIIDQVLVSQLDRLARENQVTVNTIFQAIWGILLQKYNNCDDVLFGAVVSGRPPEIFGIERMVGLFINTVPIRVKSRKNQQFPELLRDLYQKTASLKSFEYLPLADIQAESAIKGNLIDHVMAFENFPFEKRLEEAGGDQELGFSVQGMDFYEQTNYDFYMTISPGELFQVKFIYNRLIYNPDFVDKVLEHFLETIKQVLEKPDIDIEEIAISHDFLAVESNILLEDQGDWGLD